MKTISFYSFKGGAGRTYTMANIGVALANLGYNVALLDFDFNAPGLPSKFGIPSHDVGKGVIDFVWEFITTRDPPESFDAFSFRHGDLRIIPAGNIWDQAYWRRLASEDWRELFDTGESAEEGIRFFIQDFKGAIANLQPKPDYLLIDARAGISPYGGVSNLLLADIVVCLILNNPESLDGSRLVLHGLRNANEKRQMISNLLQLALSQLRVVPVLGRFPLGAAEGNELLKSVGDPLQREFGEALSFSCLEVLHSDRGLEVKEELRLRPGGYAEDVLLTDDFVRLVDKIAPEETPTPLTNAKDRIQLLRRNLRLPAGHAELDRFVPVYGLREHMGVMVNLADSSRNVAFKVDTFCAMLEDFHRDLIENAETGASFATGASEAHRKSEALKKFVRAGHVCGKRFGQDLVGRVWTSQPKLNAEERLRAWCEFDSKVGWGFLSVPQEHLRVSASGAIVSGTVQVNANFLAEGRNPHEADLCGLMAGYIKGVTGQMLNHNVAVSHSRSACIRFHSNRASCDFTFQVLDGKPNDNVKVQTLEEGVHVE